MKKLFILIMALMLATLPIAALAAQTTTSTTTNVTRYVYTGNTGKLNVRSSPKAPADNLITRLENGTKVTVIGYLDNQAWAIIQFKMNNKTTTGYVQNRYLVSTKPIIIHDDTNDISFKKFKHVTPYTALVKPSSPGGFVNMRWAPSKSTEVMTKLYANTEVTIIATNSVWAQIYEPNTGYVGYMMLAFLK